MHLCLFLASFTLGFSMLCLGCKAHRNPLALALESLHPHHGSAIPVQRAQAWQVPQVPFQHFGTAVWHSL